MNAWLKADWPAPRNIHAVTTLRCGGCSTKPYDSLNPALHVGDDAVCVMENRSRIKKMLSLPATPVWLDQVHGNKVVRAENITTLVKADASYTAHQGVVCAVLTADCLPVLFCHRDSGQVAAAHAGWRGLLAGVLENTVKVFSQQKLLVWLGPAIGPDRFEVGTEVRDAFIRKNPEFARAFQLEKTNKWWADIYLLGRICLKSVGVKQIYGGGFCTVTDGNKFFSYRRDGTTGRMATLIWRD